MFCPRVCLLYVCCRGVVRLGLVYYPRPFFPSRYLEHLRCVTTLSTKLQLSTDFPAGKQGQSRLTLVSFEVRDHQLRDAMMSATWLSL